MCEAVKIGDLKDKKLIAENVTLAAVYNILFTNDLVCSLIIEAMCVLERSSLFRFEVKRKAKKNQGVTTAIR